jgi:exonuclease VII small subunit
MARLENQKLTQVIEQCFDLSMDGSLPREQRRDYLVLGKRLRGALLNLLSQQFDATVPEFIAANKALQETSAELAKVQGSLEDAAKALARVGELAAKLDDVLKVAEKFV